MAILLASLLDADWLRLADEVRTVDIAGVDGFSVDIMDGRFVPRLAFGPHIVSTIRGLTDALIEVHLMIANPEKQVGEFCDAGADQIIFHVEATEEPLRLIKAIKSRGLRAGLSLLQESPVGLITDHMLESIDALNFLAVPVGYGGQKTSGQTLDRITAIRERAACVNPLLAIEIDGGMKPDNCSAFVKAGADVIIIGTGIYKSGNYDEAVRTARHNMRAINAESARRQENFLKVSKRSRLIRCRETEYRENPAARNRKTTRI